MRWLVALLAILVLAGCSQGDHSLAGENAALIEHSIVVGKTTEPQVVAMFGTPRTKGLNQQGDSWTYDFATYTPPTSPLSYVPLIQLMSMRGHDSGKELRLQFDQAGMIHDWNYEETNTSRYFGL